MFKRYGRELGEHRDPRQEFAGQIAKALRPV
ncbi:hypothetical protein SBA3_20020 [Candidatus Sulfopaludibacter sp. SbA3]|nr:hypothetical protein SBA3_20020 [Candidatus Sulfopaludibacter sp. SbA3]